MASAWLASFESHDSAGVLYSNTIGVKMDPVTGSGLSPNDLADHVSSWLKSSYKACLRASCTLDLIRVRATDGSGAEGIKAIGEAGGASASENCPKELALICSWKTDVATRSGRGHIALPIPASTAIITGSLWTTSDAFFTTTVAAFFSALDAGADWGPSGTPDGHLSHVVWSRKNSAYYDVKSRLYRAPIRWVERRQTAP